MASMRSQKGSNVFLSGPSSACIRDLTTPLSLGRGGYIPRTFNSIQDQPLILLSFLILFYFFFQFYPRSTGIDIKNNKMILLSFNSIQDQHDVREIKVVPYYVSFNSIQDQRTEAICDSVMFRNLSILSKIN